MRVFGQMGYHYFMCWKCGTAIEASNPIGRTLTCDVCGKDVRSCRNCRFYSPGSWHDCLERAEILVTDKERANFCEMFQLNPTFRLDRQAKGTEKNTDYTEAARSAFDKLFDA